MPWLLYSWPKWVTQKVICDQCACWREFESLSHVLFFRILPSYIYSYRLTAHSPNELLPMTHIMRTALYSVFIGLLITAVGCSSTPQELEDAGKPLPLDSFTKRVSFDKQWDRNVGAGQGKLYSRLTLAAMPEGICAASVNGRAACYDNQGDKIWARKLGADISAGAGAGTGQVYVATTDGAVIGLNSDDGAELWRSELLSEILAAPQGAGDRLVVQTAEGRMVGLDSRSGSKVWEYKNDEPLLTLRGTATPVIEDGVVYTGFASGKVVAVDLTTGSLIWDQAVAIASGTAEIERLVDIDASPKLTSDAVYAASFNGNLFAFSKRNGSPLWRFETSTYREVDEGFGHVYLVDEESRIYSINSRDGEQRWEQSALLNRELSAPVVFAGYLLVADNKGYLYALSQVDGSLVGRKRVDGAGVRVPMRVADDQLYIYSNDGKLAAYTLQVR